MATTEMNKLIADKRIVMDFMGVKPMKQFNEYRWNDAPHYYVSYESEERTLQSMAEYVKYDTSWDWLMPVVEKIEKIGYDSEIGFHEFANYCMFNDSNPEQCYSVGGSKIEATYKAVVEFIKWYNENETA